MNLKLNRKKVISMIKNKILTATLAVGLIAPLANPFIEISKAENKDRRYRPRCRNHQKNTRHY